MSSSLKPFIIPLFLPHLACPHHCLFCNQKKLHPEANLDIKSLRLERDRWLSFYKDKTRPLELAFYGGNFLAFSEKQLDLCLDLLLELPEAALRFSTRPDSVSKESFSCLKRASDRAITAELGIQSLDDKVLRRAARGHNADSVVFAVDFLKEKKIRVAGQMMLGLPGASEASDLGSAEKLIDLKLDFVRIAPTLVLKGSGLASLYHKKAYSPLGFEEAVQRSAKIVELLEDAGISVSRIGLQTDKALEESILAGPYHPSMGEYVRSFILGNKLFDSIAGLGELKEEDTLNIRVSPNLRGRLQGMNNMNLKKIKELIHPAGLKITTDKDYPIDFWALDLKRG